MFMWIFTNHVQLFVLVPNYYVWSLWCSAFPVPVVDLQKIYEINSLETKQDYSTAGGSDEIVLEVVEIVVVEDNEDSAEPKNMN